MSDYEVTEVAEKFSEIVLAEGVMLEASRSAAFPIGDLGEYIVRKVYEAQEALKDER